MEDTFFATPLYRAFAQPEKFGRQFGFVKLYYRDMKNELHPNRHVVFVIRLLGGAHLLRKLGVDRLILVTSALHMPRVRGLFGAQRLVVISALIDHEAVDTAWDIRNLLPNARALNGSGNAINECHG